MEGVDRETFLNKQGFLRWIPGHASRVAAYDERVRQQEEDRIERLRVFKQDWEAERQSRGEKGGIAAILAKERAKNKGSPCKSSYRDQPRSSASV